jgi:hypothetical protein
MASVEPVASSLLMSVGSSASLYLIVQADLVFTVELLSINGKK